MKVIDKSTLQLTRARLRLAVLWLPGSGLIFLVLVIQSVSGKYEGEAQEVWGWILPTLLPTLSLILAVLGAGALEPTAAEVRVRSGFYVIALWLSASYLALILATILVEPFTPFEPLALYKLSSLWLAPFQGLVTSAIAVLFFTRQKTHTRSGRTDPAAGETPIE